MGNEQSGDEIHLPDDTDEVTEIAGAETDEEVNLAIAQARLIGDLD